MSMLPAPVPDQAEGLRQMFAPAHARFVPVVANPHVPFSGVLLERLTSACADLELHTLVVDAADGPASRPQELTLLDLAEGVERLTPQTSYLAARGLSLRHVDAEGSTSGFLHALAAAAPLADVVLVHAGASELARLFARRAVRPLLLADDRPDSVTHAYAALKLLALRAGLVTHDLLLAAAPQSPRAERIATQLARCADDFLGALLHDAARIDPASSALDATSPALRRFVCDLLLANEPGALPSAAALQAKLPRAATERAPWAWPEPAVAWAA
jgi:flagellar biosynthesis protein FlhG